jgi:RNA polymerase sigma factor (TIGR02999 family)
MSDVTQILSQIEAGDGHAAERLLPLVYEELRRLASQKLAHEKPGLTPQATSLVHEAYLRLVDVEPAPHWNGRGHFFGAAAEAMRRILVERARRRCVSHLAPGETSERPQESEPAGSGNTEQLFAVHEVLDKLAAADRLAAEFVKLRYFVGLTMEETAEVLGISVRSAHRIWAYARAWLRRELNPD